MAKYRKKNLIDAYKFEGYINSDMPLWVAKAFDSSDLFRDGEGKLYVFVSVNHISKECPKGSWIVSDGGKLNIYDQNKFEQTFERIVDVRNLVGNPYEPSDVNEVLNSIEQQRKYGKVYSNDGTSNIRSTF